MKHVLSVVVAWIAAGMIATAQVGSLINYGAVIKDSLRLESSGAFMRMPAGGSIRWGDANVGALTIASLTSAQTWVLPNESGTLLTSMTQFSAASGSAASVSGTYNLLNIQLNNDVVTTSHIADGTITNSDISTAAAIAVGKLAPGNTGEVLATVGTVPQWTPLTSLEDDPQVGTFSTGQVAFWSGTALVGSTNLFWDNANARFGIGTSSPTVALDATGSVRLASAASTTVVIGNVSADGKLRVGGSIRADGYRSADGTASTPAYRFVNSASTGMFSPASNNLAFSTGGTERIRIDGSGNVGIGTSSPTTRLSVSGTVAATQYNGALQYGISAGTGLSGGTFNNMGNVTFALTNTGVAAGTYGSATHVPQITVDAQGRITSATNVAVSFPSEADPAAWRLNGNSGTTPTTHFLGTTDAKPLVIKVNGEEVFRFEVPDLVTAGWSIHRGGGNARGLYAVDLQISRDDAASVASGNFSVIAGGSNNTASQEHSTVGGGSNNSAIGPLSTIGGGYANTALSDATTVAGGRENQATGIYATIGGGSKNTASGLSSVVAGGGDILVGNSAIGDYSGVLGGLNNTASGEYSTVTGGSSNAASGVASVVGGGQHNTAVGLYTTIAGGHHLRLGDYSFGYSGQEIGIETNLSDSSHLAAFVDVDVWLYNVRNQASQLRFYEPSASGKNFTAFRAQAQTANIVYTLPATLTPTTSPAAALLQTDAAGNLSWVDPASIASMSSSGWAIGGNSLSSGPGVLGTTSNHALSVVTNNTEALHITTGQDVGIGHSTPQSRVHVHGGGIRVTTTGTGSNSSDGFVIEHNGNNVQLRQNENAEIQFRTNAGGGSDTVKMRLTAGGQLLFFDPSNGAQYRIDLPNSLAIGVGMARARSWGTYSSGMMKQNIVPLEGAMEKVMQLRGVRYQWKPEYGGNWDVGFIAEEVWPVLPEAVHRSDKGEYLAMDYMRVVPVLVEALKEEHRRNDMLQKEITQLQQLRDDVEQLRSQVEQLQAVIAQLSARLQMEQPTPIQQGDGGEFLGDNKPNPHDGTTTIPYYVPSPVVHAELRITNHAGRRVRTIPLYSRSTWASVVLDMSTLASGTYEYSLVFDGKVVATKQMQLVR